LQIAFDFHRLLIFLHGKPGIPPNKPKESAPFDGTLLFIEEIIGNMFVFLKDMCNML
jgi:hypothetical protein